MQFTITGEEYLIYIDGDDLDVREEDKDKDDGDWRIGPMLAKNLEMSRPPVPHSCISPDPGRQG
jgi:hypothetical protein